MAHQRRRKKNKSRGRRRNRTGRHTGEPNGLQPGDDLGNRKKAADSRLPPDDIGNRKFSEEEAKILKRYGGVFHRLTTGERPPETEAQERFVEVARGVRNPTTIYEQAWRKYLDHSNSKNISDILNPNNGPWRRMGWNWKKTK